MAAEKYDEAKRYGVRCDQIALILVLLTSALFIPLLPALLGQYHPTPEVLAMAKKLLYWSIPSLLLFWPRSNTLPAPTVRPTIPCTPPWCHWLCCGS